MKKQDPFSIIRGETGQRRSKAAPDSVAHYLEMCAGNTNETRNIIRYWLELEGKKKHYSAIDCIFELQLLSGCRISEAIALRAYDVDVFGRIIIRGAKGSGNRIVTVIHTGKELLRRKKNNFYIFQEINRFHVYREYKKKGIVLKQKGRHYDRVTHALRQLYVRGLRKTHKDRKLTAELIAHKNEKSQDYYM